MPPRRARRNQSAPNDVEGTHSPEPSPNNLGMPISKITMATVVEAIKELQANQNEVVATVK